MDKVIIFGATDTGKGIFEDIKAEKNVIAFVDEDNRKWDTDVCGIPVRIRRNYRKCNLIISISEF